MGKSGKPSLSALMATAPARRAKRPKKRAPAVPALIAAQDRPAALVRALFVKKFVTGFLRGESAAAALRSVRPGVSMASSRPLAHELIQAPDVRAELLRQLQSLQKRADIDEQWVHDQLLAMANCDIRDFVKIDAAGNVTEFKLHELSPEQARNIRGLRFKDGKVVDIRLVDRQAAVDSIARILKMFHVLDDSGLKDLVKDITERMSAAAKRLPPRTFDHETGEEV